jgi:putative methionine-R-sulfoxide reductase with GAF domain
MIAYDVSKLDNYIACDDDSKSEICVPCFQTVYVNDPDADDEDDFTGDAGGTGGASKKIKVRKFRTLLDIDSVNIVTFDEEDQRELEKIVALIYH